MEVHLAIIGALAVGIYLYSTASLPSETQLYVPFFKKYRPRPRRVLYPPGVLCGGGASNAVNLTDGLDGLAIMPTVMVGSALGIIAYLVGNAKFALYLHIPYVPGTGELVVFCSALAGAGLGFCGSTPIRLRCLWAMWAP